jgi:hypothetical protein
MNKLKYVVLFLFLNNIGYSQTSDYKSELIKLAEIYKKYHVAKPTNEVFTILDSIKLKELQGSKMFIKELIQDNNSITDSIYVSKPDSSTIRNLLLIRGLTWNMFNNDYFNEEEKEYGLDSLMKEEIEYEEQFANYYSMMWTSILNKNRPFDMSTVDFNLNNYGFDKNEKAIFFLESMETLGTMISGYFYVDPPNVSKAMEFISKYPTFNSKQHYEFKELDFDDFDFTFSSKKPKGSYKSYLLNKYLNTILSHAICLSENPNSTEELQHIIQNSIMANKLNWNYSETPEVFKQIYGQ